ncbi:glycosyltransferase family 2 protein [Hymenobacter humi]
MFYNKIKRLFTRSDASTTGISTRFVLLIPAHNEARLLPGLLASIQRLKYPAELYKTVVIADNCTDNTAAIAKRARGVLCLERTTPDRSDKAQALQYASGKLPFQGDSPEAVVCIIDADCALADDYLLELDKMYSQPGAASVVQSFRSVSNAFESDVTILDAAAEALRQWVLLGTRKLLGQGAFLLGLGCSMRQSVFDELAALPVTSLAEDKEWKIHLTKKNMHVAYCPTARLSYEVVCDAKAFHKQRKRWLSGYFQSLKMHGPGMLLRGIKNGNLSQLDVAADLLQPPRSILLLAAVVVGGLSFAFEEVALVNGWGWLGFIIAFALYGSIGLWLIGARPRSYLLLFSSFKLIATVARSAGAIILGQGVEDWSATRQEQQKV